LKSFRLPYGSLSLCKGALLNAVSQLFAYSENLTGQHKTTRKGFKEIHPLLF